MVLELGDFTCSLVFSQSTWVGEHALFEQKPGCTSKCGLPNTRRQLEDSSFNTIPSCPQDIPLEGSGLVFGFLTGGLALFVVSGWMDAD